MKPSLLPLGLVPMALLWAAPAPKPASDPLAEPLITTIAEISSKEVPGAKDYARMVNATLDFARRKSQAGAGFSPEVVRSGLDAVDAGEALDPKSADWPTLRKELSAYLNEEQPPPPPKQDESKDNPPENPDQKESDSDSSSQDKSENSQSSKQDDPSKPSDSKPSDGSQDPKNENPPQKPEDGTSDKGKPQDQKSKPQGSSAFGDMEKEPTPPKPPSEESGGSGERQQVGGQPKREPELGPNLDPQLVMPLQKLEQLRQQDSPAKLFQLMEGPASSNQGKKGKTW